MDEFVRRTILLVTRICYASLRVLPLLAAHAFVHYSNSCFILMNCSLHRTQTEVGEAITYTVVI